MLKEKKKKRHLNIVYILFLGIAILVMIAIPKRQNIITTKGIIKHDNVKTKTKAVRVENDIGQSQNKPKQLSSNKTITKKKTVTKKKTAKKKNSKKKNQSGKCKQINVLRDVRLRKKPDSGAKTFCVVKKGEKLQFIKEAGYGWLKVKYKGEEGFVYYLSTDYKSQNGMKLLCPNTKGKATTSKKLLAAPGIDSKVVAEVEKNTYFDITSYEELVKDEEHGWYKANVKAKVLDTGKIEYVEGYLYSKNVETTVSYSDKSEEESKPQSTSEPSSENSSEVKTEPQSTSEPSSENSPEVKTEPKSSSELKRNEPVIKGSDKEKKENETFYVITAQKSMKLYEKASTNSKVLKSIKKGDKLKHTQESSNGWLKVTVNGVEGFVHYLYTNYTKIAKKKPILKKSYNKDIYAIVDGSSVNLREHPGVTSKIVGCFAKNSDLKVLKQYELLEGEKYCWFYVMEISTGKKGFMYGKYVKIKSQNKKQEESKTIETAKVKEEQLEAAQEDIGEGQGGATSAENSSKSKKESKESKSSDTGEGQGGATSIKKSESRDTGEGKGGSTGKYFKGIKLQYNKAYKITSNPLNKRDGVKWFKGHLESYYEKEVKPGHGLKIPGRHTSKEDGTIRDKDGYICVSANQKYMKKGTKLMTSLGPAKVYDCGVPKKVIDVYVSRKYFR